MLAFRMRLVPSRLARMLTRSLCSWRTMRTVFCKGTEGCKLEHS